MARAFVEVASDVLVMTSRRFATTSTVILDDDRALVVDPSWDADELAGVAATLAARGAACAAGASTHVHYDHVLWHPTLPSVPRWATPWSVAQWQVRRDELLQPLVGDLSPELLDIAGRLDQVPAAPRPAAAVPGRDYPRDTALPDPYLLPWGGREVLLHEHDAHARGHVAMELPESRALLTGDMLSDVELPMPDAGDPDLVAYLVGLDRLADVVRRCEVLVPGHGSPTNDPLSRLDADRRYLDDVLHGRTVSDPRLTEPGMRDLHVRTIQQAAATRWGA
ncbi:MAG: MBL fold metallo-hydrolase [Candidatus Nanopelagicales bacterium]